MGNSFEVVVKVSIDKYTRGRIALPRILGNAAVNHFKDSWKNQGFDDNIVTPWKPTKPNKKNRGRAILVRTGRLRRSFDYYPTLNRVIVINDTPYSVYHNYGTKRLPQRRFMGRSRTLDEKSGAIIMRMMRAALK